MNKQRQYTFNVWLEIEQYDEATGQGRELDAPGGALARFATYEEAWDYAERVANLADSINL